MEGLDYSYSDSHHGRSMRRHPLRAASLHHVDPFYVGRGNRKMLYQNVYDSI